MSGPNHFVKFSWPAIYARIKRNTYNPEFTDDRVTFSEVDKFLSDVETVYYKIMRPVYYYVLIALIYTIFSLLFLLFENTSERYGQNDMKWIFEAGWYLSYLIIFTAGYFFYEHRRGEIEDKLQLLIHMYHSIFGARELRWVIPSNFPESIELWKDYLVSNAETYIEMTSEDLRDVSSLTGKAM